MEKLTAMFDRKLLFAFTGSILLLTAHPAATGQRAFAEYWVPQSNGETIFYYLLKKTEAGAGRFNVTYRNVQRGKKNAASWISAAAVDCRKNFVDEDGSVFPIDPASRSVGMNGIFAYDLWWLVCRGVEARFTPQMLLRQAR